jgi:hypothetical protein
MDSSDYSKSLRLKAIYRDVLQITSEQAIPLPKEGWKTSLEYSRQYTQGRDACEDTTAHGIANPFPDRPEPTTLPNGLP